LVEFYPIAKTTRHLNRANVRRSIGKRKDRFLTSVIFTPGAFRRSADSPITVTAAMSDRAARTKSINGGAEPIWRFYFTPVAFRRTNGVITRRPFSPIFVFTDAFDGRSAK